MKCRELAAGIGQKTKVFGLTALWLALISFAFVPGNVSAAAPDLSIDTFSVTFPTPTERSLDDGYVEVGERINSAAIRVTVSGGESTQRWRLYLKSSDDIFSPGNYNKKCSALRWKFDGDSPSNYRNLRTSAHLVASGSGGQKVTKAIDLRMMLGWADPPAGYSIRLVFSLAVE